MNATIETEKSNLRTKIVLAGALLYLLFAGARLNAQDILTLTDGSEMQVKVMVITDAEIRYRAFGESDAPLRSIAKSRIFMIRYENGVKEVIDREQFKEPVAVSGNTVIPASSYQKFGGPRIGLTVISPGTLSDRLEERGKNPVISQFGWQFETRLFSFEDGPSGMFEFVPLIGGMEQGMFLPSASLLVAIRGAGEHSFEFAFGPNLSVSGMGVVIAVGKNFRFRNVNFPVNIAYVPSVGNKRDTYDSYGNKSSSVVQTGHRISLVVGFNVRKK